MTINLNKRAIIILYQNIGVMALYIIGAYFGLLLAVPPGYATAIWPCSGIALGAVLVWGLGVLPGVFLGSFLINVYIAARISEFFLLSTFLTALIIGSGAALQAAGGWYLVKKYQSLKEFLERFKDIGLFVLLAGPVSCLINTTWSNTLLYVEHTIRSENFLLNWVTWWVGDSIGVLIFTPSFLILFAQPAIVWRKRIVSILLPLILSFTLVLIAYKVVSVAEINLVRYIFSQVVKIQISHLKNHLNQKIDQGILSEQVNFQEFSLEKMTYKGPVLVFSFKKDDSQESLKSYRIEEIQHFEVDNNQFKVYALASPFFVSHQFSWQVWLVLAGGFLFCVFINIILFIVQGQSAILYKNVKRLSAAYERFFPKEFLKLLKKENILDIHLGDHMRSDMTVLFADIRDFTAISEHMRLEENFDFINKYLKEMEPIIRNHHGFIDKFIGDSIMALFPVRVEDALHCAVSMLKHLQRLNQHENLVYPLHIGISINTGPMMLGIIGGGKRLEETVISDAVNLASHVESLNKQFNTECLITSTTLNALTDHYPFLIRRLGPVKVKGKAQPIQLYEVFDHDEDEIKKSKIATLKEFEEAVTLFDEKRWEEAKKYFNHLLSISPKDKVITAYLMMMRNEKQY